MLRIRLLLWAIDENDIICIHVYACVVDVVSLY